VEVTSHCQAACVYCPHTVYQSQWTPRHLSPATFAKLLPALARTGLVHLQGWGEPLLHPDFFSLVAMAKQAGCRVGTTTNGMLLDNEAVRRLAASGIDQVAFSLAGTDEKNDVIRPGTSLKKVLEAIYALKRAKEKLGTPGPAINIAYMLWRSGTKDLLKLPQVLQGLGVEQIVISTLDFVPREDLEIETILPQTTGEYEEFSAIFRETAELAKRYGLKVNYQLKEPGERRLICPENVQGALFVAADGRISPCVFANLPVSRATYYARGGEHPYQRLIFGNLDSLPLPAIWRHPAYGNFRRPFVNGKLISLCQSCLKM
jgi:MoaA/NifB/PqqE/SkfB family radical SAM enzyme